MKPASRRKTDVIPVVVVAALAVVCSYPLTVWLANVCGPTIFPAEEWRRDDSAILLTWFLLQSAVLIAITITAVIVARRCGHLWANDEQQVDKP